MVSKQELRRKRVLGTTALILDGCALVGYKWLSGDSKMSQNENLVITDPPRSKTGVFTWYGLRWPQTKGNAIMLAAVPLISFSERKTHSRPIKLIWKLRSLKAFPSGREINVWSVL